MPELDRIDARILTVVQENGASVRMRFTIW